MIAKFNPAAVVIDQKVVTDDDNEQRLIRTLSTGEVLSEVLIPVELNKHICMRCLSHDVSIYRMGAEKKPQLVCHACNARYGALPHTNQ